MHLCSVHGEIGLVLSGRTGLHVKWDTGEPVAIAEKVFLYLGSAALTKAQGNAVKTIQVVGR